MAYSSVAAVLPKRRALAPAARCREVLRSGQVQPRGAISGGPISTTALQCPKGPSQHR